MTFFYNTKKIFVIENALFTIINYFLLHFLICLDFNFNFRFKYTCII